MSETAAAQPQQPSAGPGKDVVFANALCAVDGTRGSYAAVEQAGRLVGPRGRLTLLTVTAVAGGGAAIGPNRAQRILDQAAALAGEAGVTATRLIDPGRPPDKVILGHAAGHALLAIGAPVTSWLGGMFVGGVGAKTIGSFSTPLLAARTAPGGPEQFARRILVASDGIDDSEQVVELAARLARSQGAEVTLLHAVGVESEAGSLPIERQARVLGSAIGGEVQSTIEAANAHEAILRAAASTKASLIVMGSRRRGGLHAVGSVSRRVVHEARCSVLLVPPTSTP